MTKTDIITEYIEKEKKMNKTITIGIFVTLISGHTTTAVSKSNSMTINGMTTSMKEE